MRALKLKAIRLRKEDRLSARQIATKLGVPKRTAAMWVQPYPLLKKEVTRKLREAGKRGHKRGHRRKKDRGEESRFHKSYPGSSFSSERKARIAEAAVLFRLTLHGFEPYGPVFDGEKIDWVVMVPKAGHLVRLQVKWAAIEKRGLPIIRLRCSNGRNKLRRYREGEYDFVVGYDYYTDTAYVFPFNDVHSQNSVTINPEAAEKWNLLRGL